MKILIDTNIFLDVFLDREGLAKGSLVILEAVFESRVKGVVCAHSIPTLYYLLQKSKVSTQKIKHILTEILTIFEVGELNKRILNSAQQLQIGDYEDAIVSEIAHLENCQWIVTRNTKDFKNSIVPPRTPEAIFS
jgi:predicted nucleic acid-binding protein